MADKRDQIADDIKRELSEISGGRIANVHINFRDGSLLWEGAIAILAVIGDANTVIQFYEYSSKIYPYVINKVIRKYIAKSKQTGSMREIPWTVLHPQVTTQTSVQIPATPRNPPAQYVIPKEIYINAPPMQGKSLSDRLVMILLTLNILTVMMTGLLMYLFFLKLR
jgi:hypothetical protein